MGGHEGAALLAAIVLLAATLPSGDYMFVPNSAHPVAEKVAVAGEDRPDAAGGIYYVDVRLKKARWLDRLVPFVRPDGASIVPAHAVTAPGQSFADRIADARVEMNRSEEIAAAVEVARQDWAQWRAA